MSEEKTKLVKQRNYNKSMTSNAQPPAGAGYVKVCYYCGEKAPCPTCRTKAGRQLILDENLKVLKELRKKGYCQETVNLISP